MTTKYCPSYSKVYIFPDIVCKVTGHTNEVCLYTRISKKGKCTNVLMVSKPYYVVNIVYSSEIIKTIITKTAVCENNDQRTAEFAF